jgi:type II secretory pathway component PulF
MSDVSERPEYLQRIDQALASGGKLACAIQALTAETHSKFLRSELKDLVCALQSQPTAEQFVNDGPKAAWLPLVLRASASEDFPGDFKRMLTDLTVATEIAKNKWSQFLYPMIVLTIAITLFFVLATTIVPTFQAMFVEFDLKLPASTSLLLKISSFIRADPALSIVGLALVLLAAITIRKVFHYCLRYLEGSMFVGAVLSGNAESVRAMGRFTATLAELLNVGAPLSDAILISGRASRNVRFLRNAQVLSKEIAGSTSMRSGYSVAHNFPVLVFRALEAGPNQTPSIPLLRRLSSIYFERVKQRFEWSTGLFAPLSIIGVGCVVGFVVISLFIPLASLITSLSG